MCLLIRRIEHYINYYWNKWMRLLWCSCRGGGGWVDTAMRILTFVMPNRISYDVLAIHLRSRSAKITTWIRNHLLLSFLVECNTQVTQAIVKLLPSSFTEAFPSRMNRVFTSWQNCWRLQFHFEDRANGIEFVSSLICINLLYRRTCWWIWEDFLMRRFEAMKLDAVSQIF